MLLILRVKPKLGRRYSAMGFCSLNAWHPLADSLQNSGNNYCKHTRKAVWSNIETMRDGNSKKSKVFYFLLMENELFSWEKMMNLFVFYSFRCLGIVYWLFICFVKLSWSKKMVRKWFNIKSKTEDFQADDVYEGGIFFFFSLYFKIFSLPVLYLSSWGWI